MEDLDLSLFPELEAIDKLEPAISDLITYCSTDEDAGAMSSSSSVNDDDGGSVGCIIAENEQNVLNAKKKESRIVINGGKTCPNVTATSKTTPVIKIIMNSSQLKGKQNHLNTVLIKRNENKVMGEAKMKKDGSGLTKNALAARENRIKKKMYVQELELKLERMTTELEEVKSQVRKQKTRLDEVETENKYLRGVLVNQTEISALVRAVKTAPGVKFNGSSWMKRENDETKSGGKRRKLNDNSKPDGESPVGVCLHVAGGSMSLEFCPTCSSRASSTKSSSSLRDGSRVEVEEEDDSK